MSVTTKYGPWGWVGVRIEVVSYRSKRGDEESRGKTRLARKGIEEGRHTRSPDRVPRDVSRVVVVQPLRQLGLVVETLTSGHTLLEEIGERNDGPQSGLHGRKVVQKIPERRRICRTTKLRDS